MEQHHRQDGDPPQAIEGREVLVLRARAVHAGRNAAGGGIFRGVWRISPLHDWCRSAQVAQPLRDQGKDATMAVSVPAGHSVVLRLRSPSPVSRPPLRNWMAPALLNPGA